MLKSNRWKDVLSDIADQLDAELILEDGQIELRPAAKARPIVNKESRGRVDL